MPTPQVSAALLPAPRNDGTDLIEHDPWLAPYADKVRQRFGHYKTMLARLEEQGGLMGPVSQAHHYFGFNRGERDGKAGVWYREWAPGARLLCLTGDFNGWDRWSHPMQRDEYGVWHIFLSDEQYADRLTH